MVGRSSVAAQVCTPGTLTVQARGRVVQGAPEATILLDAETLAVQPISGDAEFEVAVPRAGALQIFFGNADYRAEVRSVQLSDLRLRTPDCGLPAPDRAPANPRNTYVPESRILVLLEPEPVTFTACQAGQLMFRMSGQPAAGEPPVITASQGGVVLATLTATAQSQTYSVQLAQGGYAISMVNPYARELPSRSLTLERLTWTPR